MRGAARRPIEVVHGMPPKRPIRKAGKSRSKPEEVLWRHLQHDAELRDLFEHT
jgi:hypothetical protein